MSKRGQIQFRASITGVMLRVGRDQQKEMVDFVHAESLTAFFRLDGEERYGRGLREE